MTFSSISKTTGFEIQTRGILYVTSPTPPPCLDGLIITIKQTYFSTSPQLCVIVFFSLILTCCHCHFHSYSSLQRNKSVGYLYQRGLEKEMVLITSKEYEKHNYMNRDVQP